MTGRGRRGARTPGHLADLGEQALR